MRMMLFSGSRGRTWSRTAIAVESAYATSCTGVAPASWRWYEQMLIGFQRGTSSTVNAIMSAISRIEGSGGNAYVPRDRNSLMMSFWVVARLRGQVERHREPRLALGQVAPVQLVRLPRRRMTGVGAHHPGAVALGEAMFAHAEDCMVGHS